MRFGHTMLAKLVSKKTVSCDPNVTLASSNAWHVPRYLAVARDPHPVFPTADRSLVKVMIRILNSSLSLQYRNDDNS